jgi:hypothetical protein
MNHVFLKINYFKISPVLQEKRRYFQAYTILSLFLSFLSYAEYFSTKKFNLFKNYIYLLEFFYIDNLNIDFLFFKPKSKFYNSLEKNKLELLYDFKVLKKKIFFDTFILKLFKKITYQIKNLYKYPIIFKENISLVINKTSFTTNNIIPLYTSYISNYKSQNLNNKDIEDYFKFFLIVLNLKYKYIDDNKDFLANKDLILILFRKYFLLHTRIFDLQKIVEIEYNYFIKLKILRIYKKIFKYISLFNN